MLNLDLDLLFSGFIEGIYISVFTLLATFILEILSIEYIFVLLRKNNGKNLYFKSICMNLINNLILSTISYAFFTYFFSNNNSISLLKILVETLCILSIQSILYFLIHILMHTETLYFIHSFHHMYSDIVLPVSANSVSIYEFILAYMMPFILSIVTLNPHRLSLKLSIGIVSISNLIIHTPWLSDQSKLLPDFLVKTSDHIDHHKKFKIKFAAPILNLDYFIKKFFS